MADRFTVRATPAARDALNGLRGRAKAEYEALLPALKAQGCRAAGYRLLAPDQEGFSDFCCKHLSDDWRLITTFDGKVVSIEALGQHDGSAFYKSLGGLGIGDVGQKRDDKPDCCGKDGWPSIGATRAARRVERERRRSS